MTMPRLERKLEKSLITWRSDGLCMRILGILNGKFLAEKYDLQHWVAWPSIDYLKKVGAYKMKNPHSIRENCRTLFSSQFLIQHYLDENIDGMPDAYYFTPAGLRQNKLVLQSDERFYSALSEPLYWITPVHLNDRVRAGGDASDFPRFFRKDLFSPDVSKALQAVSNLGLPEKRIAIHYRSGDVIYGRVRLLFKNARRKTISLAVALHFCKEYVEKGYSVFVFGAHATELKFLSDRFENVYTVADLNLPKVPEDVDVLRDAVIMSECEILIAADFSGVSLVANLIGSVTLKSLPELIHRKQEMEILEKTINSPIFKEFHPLQRAFSYFCLFNLTPIQNFEKADQYLLAAFENDPENIRYLVFLYINALASINFSLAETYKRQFFDLVRPSDRESQGDNLSAMSYYFRELPVKIQRLLTKVSHVEGLNKDEKSAILGWLEKK